MKSCFVAKPASRLQIACQAHALLVKAQAAMATADPAALLKWTKEATPEELVETVKNNVSRAITCGRAVAPCFDATTCDCDCCYWAAGVGLFA